MRYFSSLNDRKIHFPPRNRNANFVNSVLIKNKPKIEKCNTGLVGGEIIHIPDLSDPSFWSLIWLSFCSFGGVVRSNGGTVDSCNERFGDEGMPKIAWTSERNLRKYKMFSIGFRSFGEPYFHFHVPILCFVQKITSQLLDVERSRPWNPQMFEHPPITSQDGVYLQS